MTHVERIEAVLKGEPVDRLPVSFWRHYYLAERTGQGLAQAMLYFWRRYQWDFLKVNPRSCYQAEAWGAEPKYGSDEHTPDTLTEWPVTQTSDWAEVAPVSPTEGPFAEQLEALSRIKEGLAGECYFIETVFSPLATLGKLSGGPEPVKQGMVDAPDAIHAALAAVAETLAGYVEEVLKLADGIFFATTIWAANEHLTPTLYEEFGRPYDLQVLSRAQQAHFNVLHVCQEDNFVRQLVDYPVHAINWNGYASGNPDLLELAGLTDTVLIGGIDHERVLLGGRASEVRAHVEGLLAGDLPPKFVVGGGCVIDTRTSYPNLMEVKNVLAGGVEEPA